VTVTERKLLAGIVVPLPEPNGTLTPKGLKPAHPHEPLPTVELVTVVSTVPVLESVRTLTVKVSDVNEDPLAGAPHRVTTPVPVSLVMPANWYRHSAVVAVGVPVFARYRPAVFDDRSVE